MTGRRGPARTQALFLAALAALAVLAAFGADRGRRSYFTTADEPDHVRACRELRSGPGVVSNFEHPVLMKVLGAAGLEEELPGRLVDEVRSARRAFPLVFALLVLAAGAWAGARAGPVAGFSVAAVVALEPTLRGHAPVVHTDVLLATLLLAAAALLDLPARRSPSTRSLLFAGSVYGLALAAKYSALPYLPVFLAAAAVRIRGPFRPAVPAAGKRRRGRAREAAAAPPSWGAAAGRAALLVGLPALLVAALVQQAVVAGTTSRADLLAGIDAKFRGFPYHAEAVTLGARLPRGLAAYAAGLYWVKASALPGSRINYFLGEVSGEGRFFYFPVALALKLTTATVAALVSAAAAAAALLLAARGLRRRRRLRLLAARSLLPAFLAAAYAGAAMLSDVNIGVRHVAPAVPLLLVAAAGVLRGLDGRRLHIAVPAAVVLLAGLEASAYAGREIPFGNVLAGGPSGLRRFLSDSNVDWGERLGDVFERAKAGDLGRVGVVSLFWDERAAAEAGVVRLDAFRPGNVDAVFVSVFFQDLGDALQRSRSPYRKLAEFRAFLGPLLSAIHAEAASVEPFRDEYLLIHLRTPATPPAPSR